MIRRLDVRIVITLILTALVPMAASIYLVQQAVHTSLGIGLNRDVAENLNRGVGAFRQRVTSIKVAQRVFMDRVVDSSLLQEACLDGGEEALGIALQRLRDSGPEVARIRVERRSGPSVSVGSGAADGDIRAVEKQATFLVGDCRRVKVVFGVEAQILDDFERAARFAATYGTLYEAPRTYLAGRVVLAYALLLMVVAGISIWFGVVQTRRMARRIHMLSRATRSVAEGDLSVRLTPGDEDEVGELIGSFNRMVEEISSARTRLEYLQKINAWQDIARRLAHEIKNPLTPIHLAVQQMKNKYRENDPAFGPLLFQSVDIIEEEVATLSRLVSDFSAFAKLPRVSPEPVELAAFLADCRSSLDYMGGQKNIDIVFEMPDERIVVDMDVMMMKRVMDNLVRNAAEALADADVTGPRVRISARTTGAKGKKEAQIRIEDNGPGIRPEHHPSIFEPYFTTKEEGTGLGLAIAKKIVLDHNGTIRIDETRPSGACFIVQLPVAAGAKAAAKEERA